ncbi:hypothetical protein QTL95_04770 [Rhizobium sp. S152]|uniref:hypothetical protein n=1 Tax=Rhizobium sp. S152 TaxID=3055038 RepID=UPI0025AA1605|nr:hypothetical protein [Rhizobium sp. S152]MDM9625198.1 hypothetical protein [Rhizobium sp. S152]
MDKGSKAQQAVEETGRKPVNPKDHPAAGPHAKDHLTDKTKTPGTGSLSEKDDASVSPGGG